MFNSHSDGILICSNSQDNEANDSKAIPQKRLSYNSTAQFNIDKNGESIKPQEKQRLLNSIKICNQAFTKHTNVSFKEQKQFIPAAKFRNADEENKYDLYEMTELQGNQNEDSNLYADLYVLDQENTAIRGNMNITSLLNSSNNRTNSIKTSLFQILTNQEEYGEKGKLFGCQIDDCSKFIRVFSNKLHFHDEECTMYTFRDETNWYELQEEKNKNQTHSVLAASISHEMITPLSCIIRFATECLENIDNKSDKNKKDKRALQNILQSSKLLRCHLKHLLDNSLFEAKKLEPCFQRDNVNRSVCEVINILDPQSKTKNLKIKFFRDKRLKDDLLFDEKRLQQVLVNLITNAIKFSKQNGDINVFSAIQNHEKKIEVRVQDDGIGISESEIEQLFTPFFRSQQKENRQMNPSGNGLGLHISRNICRALGGDLTVRSKIGVGSSFKMTLDFKLCEINKQDHTSQSEIKKDSNNSQEEVKFEEQDPSKLQNLIEDKWSQNLKKHSKLKMNHPIKGESSKVLNDRRNSKSQDRCKSVDEQLNANQKDNSSDKLIFSSKEKSESMDRFYQVVGSNNSSQSFSQQSSETEELFNNFDVKNLLGLGVEESPNLEPIIDKEDLMQKFQRERRDQGLILVADDQIMVLETIKSSIRSICAEDLTEFYSNGQQVLNRVKLLTEIAIKDAKFFPVCPVRILLLDFQMPVKNGLEVVIELKNFYDELIEKHDQTLTADLFIKQPIFIFLSAHVYNKQFVEHARKKGVDFFFEKPLAPEKLKYLQKLIEPEKVQIFRQY